jgi:hypothetical protein
MRPVVRNTQLGARVIGRAPLPPLPLHMPETLLGRALKGPGYRTVAVLRRKTRANFRSYGRRRGGRRRTSRLIKTEQPRGEGTYAMGDARTLGDGDHADELATRLKHRAAREAATRHTSLSMPHLVHRRARSEVVRARLCAYRQGCGALRCRLRGTLPSRGLRFRALEADESTGSMLTRTPRAMRLPRHAPAPYTAAFRRRSRRLAATPRVASCWAPHPAFEVLQRMARG